MQPPELEPDFAETRVRSVVLPTSPAAPWLARQLLAQWCREWLLSGAVVDEAMIVVSELVTECVAAGAETCTISASVGSHELEVAVQGPATIPTMPTMPTMPAMPTMPTMSIVAQAVGEDDLTVRRMDLVRALGASVEVLQGDGGNTVVVAIPLSRAP
jgi:hypothetical protein